MAMLRLLGRCFAATVVAVIAILMADYDSSGNESMSTTAGDGVFRKKVVVIGAGASGLVALKEMMEAGHDAIAVEKHSGIGGIFAENSSAAYEDMYLTISNYFMAFSDFPAPGHVKYSPGPEYRNYLHSYASHFGLLSQIQFNTEVVSAKLLDDTKQWAVVVSSSASGVTETLWCDMLLVATGTNQVAKSWTPPGFTGEVIHSSSYRTPKLFEGKRVLVVGHGESASDIADAVSASAKSLNLWARRPLKIAPRLKPADMPELDAVKKNVQSTSSYKVGQFLEMSTARMHTSHSMFLNGVIKNFAFWVLSKVFHNDKRGIFARWITEAPSYKAEFSGLVTKNFRIPHAHHVGRLNITISKTAIFEGRRVHFPETTYGPEPGNHGSGNPRNTSMDIDTVLLCTGYQTSFKWLEADVDWNPRTWFKHAFPPGYGDKLVFLGWARPHQGGIPGVSELVARYAALLLSGKRRLPSNYAEVALREGADETDFFSETPNLATLVDWPSFTNSMADLIGCRPRLSHASGLERKLQYLWYPMWPCWFRLVGPGANPKATDAVLSAVPFEPALNVIGPLGSLLGLTQRTISAVSWIVLYPFMGDTPKFKDLFVPRAVRFGNEISLHNMLSF